MNRVDEVTNILKDLCEKHKNTKIELLKQYWVSEWSWSPLCDGIYSYDEIIRTSKDYGVVTCYATGSNYRVYLPWDIFESKEECEKMCSYKNSFGYDWDIGVNRFLRQHNIEIALDKWQ